MKNFKNIIETYLYPKKIQCLCFFEDFFISRFYLLPKQPEHEIL